MTVGQIDKNRSTHNQSIVDNILTTSDKELTYVRAPNVSKTLIL